MTNVEKAGGVAVSRAEERRKPRTTAEREPRPAHFPIGKYERSESYLGYLSIFFDLSVYLAHAEVIAHTITRHRLSRSRTRTRGRISKGTTSSQSSSFCIDIILLNGGIELRFKKGSGENWTLFGNRFPHREKLL